jgi:ferredoxin
MRIRVFPERCEGHGLCFMADADLYPLDDDGHIAIESGTFVPPESEASAAEGALACPVAALAVEK